jgi:hypothetical protein
MEGPRNHKYLNHLRNTNNYDELEIIIDQGRALEMFGMYTVLEWVILKGEHRLFRRILEKHGLQIMDTTYCTLLLRIGASYDTAPYKTYALFEMVEMLLDAGCGAMCDIFPDYEDDDHHDEYLPRYKTCWTMLQVAWEDSIDSKRDGITAAVWCFQAIRSADGLEELLGERMQAGSTWDYEPPMKRGRF